MRIQCKLKSTYLYVVEVPAAAHVVYVTCEWVTTILSVGKWFVLKREQEWLLTFVHHVWRAVLLKFDMNLMLINGKHNISYSRVGYDDDFRIEGIYSHCEGHAHITWLSSAMPLRSSHAIIPFSRGRCAVRRKLGETSLYNSLCIENVSLITFGPLHIFSGNCSKAVYYKARRTSVTYMHIIHMSLYVTGIVLIKSPRYIRNTR